MFVSNNRRLALFAVHAHLQNIHQKREAHAEINVSFWNFKSEDFAYQGKADHQEETKCQHFECRVAVYKLADGLRSKHHYYYRHNNGNVHYPQLAYNAYS